jgi:hypothetical protein
MGRFGDEFVRGGEVLEEFGNREGFDFGERPAREVGQTEDSPGQLARGDRKDSACF